MDNSGAAKERGDVIEGWLSIKRSRTGEALLNSGGCLQGWCSSLRSSQDCQAAASPQSSRKLLCGFVLLSQEVYTGLSPISEKFTIAAAFGNVHGVYKAAKSKYSFATRFLGTAASISAFGLAKESSSSLETELGFQTSVKAGNVVLKPELRIVSRAFGYAGRGWLEVGEVF